MKKPQIKHKSKFKPSPKCKCINGIHRHVSKNEKTLVLKKNQTIKKSKSKVLVV